MLSPRRRMAAEIAGHRLRSPSSYEGPATSHRPLPYRTLQSRNAETTDPIQEHGPDTCILVAAARRAQSPGYQGARTLFAPVPLQVRSVLQNLDRSLAGPRCTRSQRRVYRTPPTVPPGGRSRLSATTSEPRSRDLYTPAI